jgi:branched-chain amino acid transport system ATP-binding protein
MLSAFLQVKPASVARKLAEEVLSEAGLIEYATSPVNALTTGLLKRLEVARALAARPKLVLFDEIMAGLTPTEVAEMTKLVAALPALGVTVIWVEHVLYAIMKTATRMLVLDRGKLIADGPPEAVARDSAVIKAYLGEGPVLA